MKEREERFIVVDLGIQGGADGGSSTSEKVKEIRKFVKLCLYLGDLAGWVGE